ncbi:MAG: PKD domain-containing protein [Deltaproteobacteria bacterium]|nr:PKD domain-containing protein [Deltaproteobacteria bacterium]
MVSKDDGLTWINLPDVLESVNYISYTSRVIAFSPNFAQDKTIYAGLQGPKGELTSAIYAYTFGPPANQPPTADAGADQTTKLGVSVTLDGTGSTDPDGDSLTYSWKVVEKPEGSNPTLAAANTSTPTFTPDMPGDYKIELVVTDAYGLASNPDYVIVSSLNSNPVADAGSDQSIIVLGTRVTLGSDPTRKSWDPDGDPLTYEWTILTKPEGSTAVLSDSASATPTFIADKRGTYEVQLIVTDSWGAKSDPDTVVISFENIAPVADAGTGGSVTVGTVVTLDGSNSTDANGDPLTFLWSLTQLPSGSSAAIDDATAEVTSFSPDLPGLYVVQLTVDDGFGGTASATVQFQVIVDPPAVIVAVQELEEETINTIPPTFLKNRNMKKALVNKLNAVIADIEEGNYQVALDKLQNDLLLKTDGCAAAGAPDKNDWITTCEEQAVVYQELQRIITMVQELQ